jgi:hypothetical protein
MNLQHSFTDLKVKCEELVSGLASKDRELSEEIQKNVRIQTELLKATEKSNNDYYQVKEMQHLLTELKSRNDFNSLSPISVSSVDKHPSSSSSSSSTTSTPSRSNYNSPSSSYSSYGGPGGGGGNASSNDDDQIFGFRVGRRATPQASSPLSHFSSPSSRNSAYNSQGFAAALFGEDKPSPPPVSFSGATQKDLTDKLMVYKLFI